MLLLDLTMTSFESKCKQHNKELVIYPSMPPGKHKSGRIGDAVPVARPQCPQGVNDAKLEVPHGSRVDSCTSQADSF